MYKKTEIAQKLWVSKKNELSSAEEILKRLEENPELFQEVKKLVGLIESSPNDPRNIDDIEEELIEVLRKMGQKGMKIWAEDVGKHSQKQAQQSSKNYHYGKKKTKLDQ